MRRSQLSVMMRRSILDSVLRYRPRPAVGIEVHRRPQAPAAPRLSTSVATADLDECAICLTQMKKGERVAALPCLHRYHQRCLEPWSSEHNSCPTCRAAF